MNLVQQFYERNTYSLLKGFDRPLRLSLLLILMKHVQYLQSQINNEILDTLNSLDSNTNFIKQIIFYNYNSDLSYNILLILLVKENMKNTLLSVYFQVHYCALFKITIDMALANINKNYYISALAIMTTILICIIHSIHDYDYKFQQKDYLALRNPLLRYIYLALEISQSLLQYNIAKNGFCILNVIFNSFYCLIDIIYFPYLDSTIQIFSTTGFIYEYRSYSLINQLRLLDIQQANLKIKQGSTKKARNIDFCIRFLLNHIQFDFDQYLTSQASIILDQIVVNHQINCNHPKYCFCSQVDDINNLASKSVRCQYFNNQIEILFEAIFKNYKTAKITNISYLMFVADIIQNPTKCIVQALRYSNENKRNWFLNQQLYQIVMFAKQKFQNFKGDNQSQALQEQDRIFYESIIFDKKIIQCFNLLRQCLEEKKIALQQIGQDDINIQQTQNYFMQIRKKRNNLENILKELSEQHYNNQVLIYLVDIFESTLQFNQKLGRNLSKLKKKYHNLPKHVEDQFDQQACTVFISLTKKIGEIKMVSNNFERVVPVSSNSEAIGKNINFMIPYEIAQYHDKILQKYIEDYTPKNTNVVLNLQIAKDNEGWGIPYTIKMQNFQLEMKDFGVCANIKQIIDYNIYLSVNLRNQYQVLAMQKKFYETFLSKSLNESSAQNLNIDILIPAFKQIFLKNEDKRAINQFQTIIVNPRNQQELGMLRTINKEHSNLNNLLELNLYLMNGEYQIIDNQFISIVQIKITNINYLEDRASKTYEIFQINQLIQNSSNQINNNKLESKCSQEEFFDINQQYNYELQQILFSANSPPALKQFPKQVKSKNIYQEKQEITVNQSNFMDSVNQLSCRENQNIDQTDLGITTIDINKNVSNFVISPLNSFRNQSSNQLLIKFQELPQTQQAQKQLLSKQKEIEKSPISQENYQQKKYNSIKNNSQYGTDTNLKILSDKEIEQSTNNLKQTTTELILMKQTNQNIDYSIQSDDNQQEAGNSHIKRTSTKKMQEGQIAQSVHSQQSTRSHKRDHLVNQIQKKQNLTGLLILKLFGICSLILFLFLNILNFYLLEREVIFQRDDYVNIDWGSTLRETFSQVIGDQNLLGQLQIPYFKNPPQQQAQILKNILDYQKQRYQIMRTLIQRFEQTDKSKTNLYEYVLDKKQKLYFGYTVTRNVTFDSYFGYVQIACLGYLYQVSSQIDVQSQNQLQLIVNYLETVNTLDSFQADVQNKLTQELDNIVNQAQLSLIIIVCVSSVVSLSIIFLFWFIQKKREEILILLTTISPQKIVIMMDDTLFYLQQVISFQQLQTDFLNKSKKTGNDQSKNQLIKACNYQVKYQNQNGSGLIKKKKLISSSTRLPKFKLQALYYSCIFLVLTQMHAISLYIISLNFRSNETTNRDFLNGLYKLNDYVISISGIRAPLIITKLLNYQDYFYAYLLRTQNLLNALNQQSNSFYNLVEKQYKETRFEQSQFEDYVYRILQSDACNAVKDNTNLLIEQGFDYNQCLSTQNGVLNTGLVKSVQFLFEMFKSRMPVYLIQDPKQFMKQILLQENDFSTFNSYYFRIYFNYIIETIYRKINILSNDYYEYILKINHLLISISLVSFAFTFYLVYHKFFVIQIEQLTETQRILDLIDLHVIEENQYIMNYFKKFK
ncbi:hypothetical protein ABPG74_004237 [Tetrahymena malaccensis]